MTQINLMTLILHFAIYFNFSYNSSLTQDQNKHSIKIIMTSGGRV
jgi:hypothetical protein